LTTEKPLSPGQRGITLFANGRLVNSPEFFGSSESSHFFSYTTGWLDVDFIDDLEEDVIATNRRMIDWENDEALELKNYLQKILIAIHWQWRDKRSDLNKKRVQEQTGIDKDKWLSTLPRDKAEIIERAYDKISKTDVENPVEILIDTVHQIAPEYAELHWRYLHPTIHAIAEGDYINRRYFEATTKAVQLYVQRVRDIAAIDSEDMDKIFNPGNGVLQVTNCSNETERNIQNGHQFLSRGVIAGCRNPLTHNPEYEKHLVDTGLFSEKDCLDMLAVISHLFKRMDNVKKRS
jgi:uncharacterized protein (TIGR02391 family)